MCSRPCSCWLKWQSHWGRRLCRVPKMLKYGLDFVVARENKYYLSLLLTTQVHVTESGECKDLLQLHPKKAVCMWIYPCSVGISCKPIYGVKCMCNCMCVSAGLGWANRVLVVVFIEKTWVLIVSPLHVEYSTTHLCCFAVHVIADGLLLVDVLGRILVDNDKERRWLLLNDKERCWHLCLRSCTCSSLSSCASGGFPRACPCSNETKLVVVWVHFVQFCLTSSPENL